jgi:hypothetical protein
MKQENLNKINYDFITKVINQKGYKLDQTPNKLNIIGIRTANPVVDTYEDVFVYHYFDSNNKGQIHIVNGTTAPGKYWLENPSNPKGTAITKEGYYHNLWQIGTHTGYKALVQVNNITVYRDNDKNDELKEDSATEDTGMFGIDHHHAWVDGLSVAVGKWSAGCAVVQKIEDWNNISLKLFEAQVNAGLGDLFSYYLINESDFDNIA